MSSSSSSTARPRPVTFSQFSELMFIPKENKVSDKWYSSKDFHRFRKGFFDDAKRLSREVKEARVPPEHSYERVGTELFLSKGLAKRVRETQYAHVNAVLSEQERQRQIGIRDPERLARASEKSSWTQERAQDLATENWMQYIFEKK